jgi:hypothetical protein
MENNIYQSPQADLTMAETRRGSPLKAILIAAVVDFVGSLVSSILLWVAYVAYHAFHGMSKEGLQEMIANSASWSSPIHIIDVFIGSLISIYAGYLCASIANHREYALVAILGLISTTSGMLLAGFGNASYETVFSAALTFLCVYLGAWMHVRTKARMEE